MSLAGQLDSSAIAAADGFVRSSDRWPKANHSINSCTGTHHTDLESTSWPDQRSCPPDNEAETPAGAAARAASMNSNASHPDICTEACAAMLDTGDPAQGQTAVLSNTLCGDEISDAEAHAWPRPETPMMANTQAGAVDPQDTSVDSSADFVLTAVETQGKQQVMEKVFLASPRLLAELTASTSSPAEAGHHATQPALIEAATAEGKAAMAEIISATPESVVSMNAAAVPSKVDARCCSPASSGRSAAGASLSAAANVRSPLPGNAKFVSTSLSGTDQQQPVDLFQALDCADPDSFQSSASALQAGESPFNDLVHCY